MSEHADRKPKTIKIPGPDHPITIARNAHRIVVRADYTTHARSTRNAYKWKEEVQ